MTVTALLAQAKANGYPLVSAAALAAGIRAAMASDPEAVAFVFVSGLTLKSLITDESSQCRGMKLPPVGDRGFLRLLGCEVLVAELYWAYRTHADPAFLESITNVIDWARREVDWPTFLQQCSDGGSLTRCDWTSVPQGKTPQP